MNLDRKIETIAAQGVEIDAFVVPWDTEIFGFPVAQIDRLAITDDRCVDDAMRKLLSWLDSRSVRMASCRLDSRALRESMLLEQHGFRFVEIVYSPKLAPLRIIADTDDGLVIERATGADLAAIEAIAGSAFETGRYRLDWRIDPAASDRRYRAWVRNSFADSRQEVLKATVAGALAGFFIVEVRSDGSVYWHLTAIAPSMQGKGLGKRLWASMVRRHHEAGLTRIETTISAHNPPVMNIYAALGFRFGAARATFHWMRD
jgi:RimJ/RimL family protein N-acetyltransferase